MSDKQQDIFSKERRDMLMGVGALGAGAIAVTALGSSAVWAAGVDAHHHDDHSASLGETTLIKSLHDCVATSEACIAHCLDMFKTGDVSLAACAETVQESMAFCAAHAKLAAYGSPYLKDMTALGLKICAACEKECRKHEKHSSCKACADACVACMKACKALLAA